MNFFEQQRQARTHTRTLVVLFVLAVLAIAFSVSAVLTLALSYASSSYPQAEFMTAFQTVSIYVVPATILLIGSVSLYRMLEMGGNGISVALYLGGIPLPLEGRELKHTRLQNVVEEMAIASGVPVPDIYILPNEIGINAFAAGMTPSKAVIGVTQGALDELTREELQGVIAHEFSHIYNGDMALNFRLMGVLAGILFLNTLGQILIRGTRRRSSSKGGGAGLAVVGIGLMIVGWIGVFFGNWIKAAVSRQREYLADASAVQFTRNPLGLAGALEKIKLGSSTVMNPKAEEASHFFFGSIQDYNFFATHPPIDDRLKRLGSISLEAKPQVQAENHQKEKVEVNRVGNPKAEDLMKAVVVIQGLSAGMRQQLGKPKLAMDIVMALLEKQADKNSNLENFDPLIRQVAEAVPAENRLAVVELALPTLKSLDPIHVSSFLTKIEDLVHRDDNQHPFGMAVLFLLKRQLTRSGREKRKLVSLKSSYSDAVCLLKFTAKVGHTDSLLRISAFEAGLKKLGLTISEAEKVDTSAQSFSKSLTRLSLLIPQDKQKLLEALWSTAHFDHQLNSEESQYLRAVSEALEIPLPFTML